MASFKDEMTVDLVGQNPRFRRQKKFRQTRQTLARLDSSGGLLGEFSMTRRVRGVKWA